MADRWGGTAPRGVRPPRARPGARATTGPPMSAQGHPDDGVAGLAFPRVGGARSTTATGKAILAAAARPVDAALAGRIAEARDWRASYVPAFRDLTVATARSADAA